MPRPVRRGSNAQWDVALYGDAADSGHQGRSKHHRRSGGEARKKTPRQEFARVHQEWDPDLEDLDDLDDLDQDAEDWSDLD